MSDEIKKPEEITNVPLPAKDLSPEELKQVSGGASKIFGDIDGESSDANKHKGEIQLDNY